jgi:hypothetical protein
MPVARAPVQWMFGWFDGLLQPSSTNRFRDQVGFSARSTKTIDRNRRLLPSIGKHIKNEDMHSVKTYLFLFGFPLGAGLAVQDRR